jgi:hypothetical protein
MPCCNCWLPCPGLALLLRGYFLSRAWFQHQTPPKILLAGQRRAKMTRRAAGSHTPTRQPPIKRDPAPCSLESQLSKGVVEGPGRHRHTYKRHGFRGKRRKTHKHSATKKKKTHKATHDESTLARARALAKRRCWRRRMRPNAPNIQNSQGSRKEANTQEAPARLAFCRRPGEKHPWNIPFLILHTYLASARGWSRGPLTSDGAGHCTRFGVWCCNVRAAGLRPVCIA